ncbi:MAG TPA: undecaprenyldiphospho-muramoylpentapeptide beta-N-acetylglucosaminyltransferase [Actinomycetota bacterium]
MKVVVAGGGTAGHVFPAVALAERLREDGHEVGFVGSPDGQEARLVPAAGFPFHAVRAQKMVRTASIRTVGAPVVALRSVRDARPFVRGARVVVGVGGYVSAPAVLAARRAGAKVVLHEQNAIPGLANRLLSRRAEVVALSFADAGSRFPRRTRSVVTGNPVRTAIAAVPEGRPALIAEARASLDLEPGRTTVCVFGGSQGAQALDRLVAGAADALAGRADLQLLVLTGPANLELLRPAVERDGPLRVRAVGFLERIELALAVADLAVSRGGSGHLAELTVCGVPAIVVPYPHATENHQEANARELERAGAVEVAVEASLTPAGLARRIERLADDADRRAGMRRLAIAWAKPDADRRLADVVEEVGV